MISKIHFESFSWSLEQFFLTVGQNNFANKIPFQTTSTNFSKLKMTSKSEFLQSLCIFKQWSKLYFSLDAYPEIQVLIWLYNKYYKRDCFLWLIFYLACENEMKILKRIVKTISRAKFEWSPLSAKKSHKLYWFVYCNLLFTELIELELFKESGF